MADVGRCRGICDGVKVKARVVVDDSFKRIKGKYKQRYLKRE